MKQILRGFLLIIVAMGQVQAWGHSAPSFAAQSLAVNPAKLMLADSNSANPLVPTSSSGAPAAAPTRVPVDPNVTQQTQGVFQDTQQNLNLYVTQLQCQSQGINTNTCNSQNNTTNNSPTLMNSVNKFLFNSVTSELGVGVEVNF